jgi:hypothetical protein
MDRRRQRKRLRPPAETYFRRDVTRISDADAESADAKTDMELQS